MTQKPKGRKWGPWIVAGLVLMALPVHLRPAHFPADDSYFYLQVAHHVAQGNGSTFNTITPTNGYHPLWMFFCVAASWLAGGSKLLALRLVIAFQAVLFGGIAWIFRDVARDLGLRHWLVGLSLLAGFFLTGLYGSEAHINGFAVSLALWTLMRAERGEAPWGWFGLALGIAVLARLDNVFVCAGLASFACASTGSARLAIRRAVPILAFGSLVVIPYLWSNLAFHGHLVPISGAIKSHFPEPVWHPGQLGTLGRVVTFAALLALPLARGRRRSVLGGLGVGVLLHSAYLVLFTRDATTWSWYHVSGVVLLGLTASAVFEILGARIRSGFAPRLAAAVATLVLVLGVSRAWYRFYNPDAVGPRNALALHEKKHDERWGLTWARWLDENLPAGEGVLVYDMPGVLGFYSDLRIFPVDGLIGSYASNDALVREGVHEFLRASGVRYYLGPIRRRGHDVSSVEIIAPLDRVVVGSLDLPRGAVVSRTSDVTTHPDAHDLALWRIGDEG